VVVAAVAAAVVVVAPAGATSPLALIRTNFKRTGRSNSPRPLLFY
jgi:hypothetical protein